MPEKYWTSSKLGNDKRNNLKKNFSHMNRIFLSALMLALSSIVSAQSYQVGTSTTTTDYFGNKKTTHRDQYGGVTGTDRSSTDYFGNQRTTHQDRYGSTTGTSTTTTDYFGNQRTTHQDRYGYTTGTSTTTTDYFGNQKTQQRSNDANTTIWSW